MAHGVGDELGDDDAGVLDVVAPDRRSTSHVLSCCRATDTEDAAKGTRIVTGARPARSELVTTAGPLRLVIVPDRSCPLHRAANHRRRWHRLTLPRARVRRGGPQGVPRGSSVITASTPSSTHRSRSSLGVDGPDVDPAALLAQPARQPRVLPEQLDARPGDPALRDQLPVTRQECCRSMSSTSSRSGASFATRVSATHEKLITRAGESLPVQPNSSSSSTRRRSTRPAYRVGCLVSIARSIGRS